ncbi:MAG: hypothetical protein COT22_01115 [Ignavibacteria bacterium CG08_land_8_20_14_0_20_37_9]|nr:MAG: hypothetical protein COT22_01115 [Ignavibacteria bacterium CG08_land_8_20_14_0_20_37_9]PJC58779.1 MAG: hypothetical protein CO025_08275 [Ignavibacteria bacterium CG_4_9_14_0_2_um_filter_37_13]
MEKNNVIKIITIIIVILSLVFVSYLSNKNISNISNKNFLYEKNILDINDINKLSFLQQELIDTRKIKLYILIRFSDFNCSTCYINFLNFSDSLNAHFSIYSESIFFLIERDNRDLFVQKKFIDHWKKRQKIKFKHIFVQGFNKLPNVNKSSLLVREKNIIHIFPLPIPEYEYSTILKFIFDKITININ